MSACASGTPFAQQAFAVHGVVPSAIYPVAAAGTGFLPTTLLAVMVYVASAVASLATSARLSAACCTTAPAGTADRSNFIRIVFATVLSGHVYVISCGEAL